MEQRYPLVSQTAPSMTLAVVIPLYNAAPWIGRTIRSVLDQNCPGVSVIVVDDGSTDGSLAALAAFHDQITLEAGPNRGACHARNCGLALAEAQSAEYILFLDADDYLEGLMLAGSLAEARTHDADMVLSNMHLEYADGRRMLRPLYQGDVAPEDFFRGWMGEQGYVNPSGILWSVGFVRRIGAWNESLARAQDLDITMRAMLFNPKIRKNEAGAAIHARVNDGSISRNQSERALRSRFQAVSGLIAPVRESSFALMLPLLYQEIYFVARSAFREGYRSLGREILTLLRNEGYHKHPGTRLHRLAASFLGLERKVRIWGG